jgi:hypothetical protein
MTLRKKLLLLAAFAALATAALGGTAPIALGHDDPHPGHPGCTWSVDKTASLHRSPGVPISTLTLSLDQTVTVVYKIVVTRDCEEGFDPGAHGAGADVVDSHAGTLATNLFHGSQNLRDSATFTYTRDIGAHGCGEFDVVNTVDVTDSHDDHPLATDTQTIHVVVPCATGCTLTQGYWKTHSTYGPASKPDASWNLLPGGAGPTTVFFLSGASWYQVFWTAPAGNQYYNLAHQYMAARLNVLDGASAPASVATAIASATTLFQTYTPAQIGALKGSNSLRQQFVALAGTLGSYNEGQIGPGHCDE